MIDDRMTPDVPADFELCGGCGESSSAHLSDGDRPGAGQLACDGFEPTGRVDGRYEHYLAYRAANDRVPSELVASELARLGAGVDRAPIVEEKLELAVVVDGVAAAVELARGISGSRPGEPAGAISLAFFAEAKAILVARPVVKLREHDRELLDLGFIAPAKPRSPRGAEVPLATWRAFAHRRGLRALRELGVSVSVTSPFLLGFYYGCGDRSQGADESSIAWRRGRDAGESDALAWVPKRRAKDELAAIDYDAEPAGDRVTIVDAAGVPLRRCDFCADHPRPCPDCGPCNGGSDLYGSAEPRVVTIDLDVEIVAEPPALDVAAELAQLDLFGAPA